MARGKKKVLVVVTRPDNVTGDTETAVCVNGKIYQIQYNKPVEVPKAVADVLKNNEEMSAKVKVLEAASNGKTPFAEF